MRFVGLFVAVPLLAAQPSMAAPVIGYESYYKDVEVRCTVPLGKVEDCEAAINSYASVLVSTVELSVANASFTALRTDVYGTNSVDENDVDFRNEIDALFELLLPDSGAVGELQSL